MIATVPKEDLLVWDLKEGWEPLCKFLNKPIPDQERKKYPAILELLIGYYELEFDWSILSDNNYQLKSAIGAIKIISIIKPIPHDNKTGDAEYIKKYFLEAPLFQNVRFFHFRFFYGHLRFFFLRLEIQ